MSQNIYENYGIDPNKPFFALKFISKKFRNQNFLGWFLTITGFLLLITSIVLLSTIGLIGVIAILPVPLLLIPGPWIIIPLTFSGAMKHYRRVKYLFNKKDASTLKSFENLPLKDDSGKIIMKNYLLRLFGVAALIDLNDSNSNLLAVQFYRACQNNGMKENEARVIIEVLALKRGTSARDYIGY
ncbi:MAG: hypothetical protein ACFFDW_12640 [Candidatus Thorarchaeota archaeon]